MSCTSRSCNHCTIVLLAVSIAVMGFLVSGAVAKAQSSLPDTVYLVKLDSHASDQRSEVAHDPDSRSSQAVESSHDNHGPGKINLIYGFLGEKEGVEPNLLWRTPGMPVPFAANIINFVVFAYIVVRFGKKPIQQALKKRRDTIMSQIDEAAKMKHNAQQRLEQYETKMQHIDDEVERIKQDFAAQGEREKKRILQDAREKKQRMLKDAQFMIDQERKQMRNVLMREAIQQAIDSAEKVLMNRVTEQDHERIADSYIRQLVSAGMSIGASGGGAAGTGTLPSTSNVSKSLDKAGL